MDWLRPFRPPGSAWADWPTDGTAALSCIAKRVYVTPPGWVAPRNPVQPYGGREYGCNVYWGPDQILVGMQPYG